MTDKFKAWLCLKSAFGTKPKTALELVKKYPHPEEYVGNPQHPIYEDDTIPPQIKEQLLQLSLIRVKNRLLNSANTMRLMLSSMVMKIIL
jgi:DNA processing protein